MMDPMIDVLVAFVATGWPAMLRLFACEKYMEKGFLRE